MNAYIKFGIFAAVIITVLILSFIILRRVFRKAAPVGKILSVVCAVSVLTVSFILLYPFDISRGIEAVAVIDSPEPLSYVSELEGEAIGDAENPQWWCIYGSGGGTGNNNSALVTDSWRGIPAEVVDFPELGLDSYTYIVSYEREITAFSFNLWEHRGGIYPFYNTLKFGKAELSGEKSNNKIFVYRTKKTMIDNPLFTKWE